MEDYKIVNAAIAIELLAIVVETTDADIVDVLTGIYISEEDAGRIKAFIANETEVVLRGIE